MSASARIPIDLAVQLAARVQLRISPYVRRSMCVGSVRRDRPTVGDLEFVVEPRMYTADLLGTQAPDLFALKADALQWARWVKGGDRQWQVTDVFGHLGVTLDLYFVHPPAEWGSIVAIRTGPWQLGRVAVTRLKRAGTPHRDGHVPGHPTPTEEDFFRLAGLECRPPSARDAYADELERAEVRRG